MKRAGLLVVAVGVLALVGVGAGAGAGADETAVLGVWDVVASTPDGPLPFVMTVKKAEGRLKAEIELGGIQRTVSDEAREGDVLKLRVEYEGVTYALQGKIAVGAIEGTWEGGGNSGTYTAKKRP